MTKLRAVLKRRWLILVVALIVGVSAGVVSSTLARENVQSVYTASQVIVANGNSGATSLVSQDALKVTRGQVPILAAKRLDEDDPDALAAKVAAIFDPKTSAITVASNDLDPRAAVRRVEAFVDAFLEVQNARLKEPDRRQLAQLEQDIKAAQDELVAFDAQYPQFTAENVPNAVTDPVLIASLQTQRSAINTRIQTLQTDQRTRELALLQNLPYETLGPETPKPAQSGLIDVPASKMARAGLLGFLGLLLGGGVVMLIERLNRRIDTREELVEITDLPILAEIGFVPEKRRAVDDRGRVALAGIWAEPYRRVRSAIQFVQANATTPGSGWTPYPGSPSDQYGTPPAVFLVTSASPAEGKSTTSALVAMALAEVAIPTVLVGGDFRRPQVERLVGADPASSLQDLATLSVDRPTVDDIVRPTQYDHLYAASAGEATREVAGLVEATKEVCTEAVARGATVVIDSSPLQAANDTLDLLPVVDYVIFVLRVGRSSETDLLDAVATLRRLETQILGIVLIGTPSGRKQEYYYDYYSPGPIPPGMSAAVNGSTHNGSSNGAAAPAAPAEAPADESEEGAEGEAVAAASQGSGDPTSSTTNSPLE